MKKIMKKLMFVFVLVGLLGVSANPALATGPSVTTVGSSQTASTLTLSGYFMANGNQTTTLFEYSTHQSDLPNLQAGNGSIACQLLHQPGDTSGSFPCDLGTPVITAGTTYYYRAIATNSVGGVVYTSYGNTNTVTFTGTGSGGNGGGGGGGCAIISLGSITPSSVLAGSGAVNVVISGNTFSNSSIPRFNGSNRSVSGNITPNQMTMILTSADTATSGGGNITVVDGNCLSNTLSFTISGSGSGGSGNIGGSSGGLTYPAASVTQTANNIASNSAILNGSINPSGYTATAWFEYGTNSTLATFNETTHVSQGAAGIYSPLVQSATGLTPNTTYYFRAVANNSYGTVKGSIMSFTTGNLNSSITTIQATNQTTVSAKLNANFVNQNGNYAQGYFEYGSVASLGSTTATQNLGTNTSANFSETISGLNSGTVYYFRAVTVNQGSTYKGSVLVFQTKAVSEPVVATTDNSAPSTAITTQSSLLKITTIADNIAVGGDIEYLVSFNNNNSANLENTKISVQLPKEVDFKESNFGKVNSSNVVELDAGILVPNQVGSLTIKGKINSKASDQNVLITTAVMTYNVTGSTDKKDEIAYVTNHIAGTTGLEANSLFGTNFLPSTLVGWLALLLVVLGLGVVGRKLYSDYVVKTPLRATAKSNDDLTDHN